MRSKLAAEAIGTFALVFFGCGSIALNAQGSLSSTAISIAFGMIVMVMIYAVGHISGAHFNPAVTLGFSVSRHFSFADLPKYWGAQIFGAILAMILLKFIFGSDASSSVTTVSIPVLPAFVVEFVITFFLMFVIIAVATDTRAVGMMAGLAIGSTVALGAFFGGSLTGASMNPARSLAPALVWGQFSHLWVYMIAPLLGGMAGAKAYQWVRCDKELPDTKKGCC